MRRVIGLLPLLHGLPLLAYLLLRGFVTNSVPDVVPERQWWRLYNLVTLLNEFTPLFFLPLPLWLVTLAIGRTLAALFATALPWIMFASLYGDLFVPRPVHLAEWFGRPNGQEVRLRVMTFNVLAADRPAGQLMEIVKSADPDVLVVQEAIPPLALALQAALGDTHRYSRLRTDAGWGAQAIWSRYPIVHEERWDGSRRGANWQHAILEVEGHALHVVNLHLSTPRVTWRTPEALPVPVAVGEVSEARTLEVASLVPRLRSLVAEPDPLVVAGDLNLTDQTPEFRRLLSTGLADAYRQAGWGLGLTFPAVERVSVLGRSFAVQRPLVGIDHILLSSELEARRAQVWPQSGRSDHRPVVADLALRRAAG